MAAVVTPASDMRALWDEMRALEAINALFPHLQKVRPRARLTDSPAVRVQVRGAVFCERECVGWLMWIVRRLARVVVDERSVSGLANSRDVLEA